MFCIGRYDYRFGITYNDPSDVWLDYVDKYEAVEWFKKWFGDGEK